MSTVSDMVDAIIEALRNASATEAGEPVWRQEFGQIASYQAGARTGDCLKRLACKRKQSRREIDLGGYCLRAPAAGIGGLSD
jgi:hypothetical protein